jgi:hypothetical protein
MSCGHDFILENVAIFQFFFFTSTFYTLQLTLATNVLKKNAICRALPLKLILIQLLALTFRSKITPPQNASIKLPNSSRSLRYLLKTAPSIPI